jgi:hypothetical protein
LAHGVSGSDRAAEALDAAAIDEGDALFGKIRRGYARMQDYD